MSQAVGLGLQPSGLNYAPGRQRNEQQGGREDWHVAQERAAFPPLPPLYRANGAHLGP